jgi:hypothetical protein
MFSNVLLLVYILEHSVNSFGYKTNDGTPVSLQGYPSVIFGSTPPLQTMDSSLQRCRWEMHPCQPQAKYYSCVESSIFNFVDLFLNTVY